MRFLVLGPLSVERAGRLLRLTGRRELLLLAGLLAHRNESVPVTRLASLVWGPDGEPSRNALQARISHLRRALGLEEGRLVFAGDGYRLRVEPGESDDDVLSDVVARAQTLLSEGHPAEARDMLGTALAAVRGETYAPVGGHAFILAAATRVNELLWAARELRAGAMLEAGEAAAAAALAAALVAEQPLRHAARVVLMRALDAQGRRAEALASYDDGRRRLAAATGLEPPPVLRAVHAEILHRERTQIRTEAAGPGVLEPPEMIAWLADDGHLDAALRLAARCAWGWWLTGDRGRGRRLLIDLLDQAEGSGTPEIPVTQAARLWAAALACQERDEPVALAGVDAAAVGDPGDLEALAMVLLADRRTERGEHEAAARLLKPADRALRSRGDRWGITLATLAAARLLMLRGAIDSAERLGREALHVFHKLHDPAGQLATDSLLGYTAEIRGDWRNAIRHHQRALLLAQHGGWAHAQCTQLTRLASVTMLSGQPLSGRQRLTEALAIGRRLESPLLVALVRNVTALADARAGDIEAAAEGHRFALRWYRHAGSASGVALTTAALARVSPAARATALLDASWDAALDTGDPRALAFTAESFALLAASPDSAAYYLGVADGLRGRCDRSRARGEQPQVDRLADQLSGADQHERGHSAGAQLADRLGIPATNTNPVEGARRQ